MKELTLSQILEEAFERARDLDAPLGARLEFFAESVRMASPAFAEAVDRLVLRLTLSGSGARLLPSAIKCRRSCCRTTKGV